jgi:hypothetical protein
MSEADLPAKCAVCGAEDAQRIVSCFSAGGCGTDASGRFT